MKTCVIIPTYNEAKDIGRVVKQVKEQGLEVIVVDDGSVDNTSEIAKNYGATVLENKTNEGKGASLINGFHYALDNGFDAVINMDGDGQHLAEDIPFFLRLAKYSKSGVLVGNRMSNRTKNMPFLRFLVNKFMSWLISTVAKQRVADTQCGFRLIKKEVLEKIQLETSKYEIESEIIIKAARLGFKIESVPIKTIYQGERSHINPFVDTLRFIRFIVRELWTMPP